MRKIEFSKTLETLLDDLKKVFYGDDPRYNGENPACWPIEAAITKELDKLTDDELRDFVEELDAETDELLHASLWDLSSTREVLQDTKYYLGATEEQ